MGTITDIAGSCPVQSRAFLGPYIESTAHSWSIGVAGAIGEFMHDNEEQAVISYPGNKIEVSTSRGALRIHMEELVTCFAREQLSHCTRSWTQQVVFCLTEEQARIAHVDRLTCLGEDTEAVNNSARDMVLFDLGVGSPYARFCIRSDNGSLNSLLLQQAGRSIFEPGNPVPEAILNSSPARVVISALGRIEIETPIPRIASETIRGPHTHLLPAMLAAGRKAGLGLPDGWIDCLSLYPEHPAVSKYGDDKVFDRAAFENFQLLMEKFGLPGYLETKHCIWEGRDGPAQDSRSGSDIAWVGEVNRIADLQAHHLQKWDAAR